LAESDNGDVDIGHLSVGWLDESLCYTPHERVNARVESIVVVYGVVV